MFNIEPKIEPSIWKQKTGIQIKVKKSVLLRQNFYCMDKLSVYNKPPNNCGAAIPPSKTVVG